MQAIQRFPLVVGILVTAVCLAESAFGQSTILAKNIEGTLYADQFSGSDWCAQIESAIASLPSNGGTIDGRNLTGTSNACNSYISLPADTTLLLGSNTYNLGPNSIYVYTTGTRSIGNGSTATEITYAGTGSAIASQLFSSTNYSPPQNSQYEGFSLLYTGQTTNSSQGIYMINPIQNSIRCVDIASFTGASINLQVLSAFPTYGTLNTIENVNITNCSGYGIVLQGSALWQNGNVGKITATRIANSDIQCTAPKFASAPSSNPIGLWISGADATTVSATYFDGSPTCLNGTGSTCTNGSYVPGGTGISITPDDATGTPYPANYTNLFGDFVEELDIGISVAPGLANPTTTTEIGTNSFQVTTLRNYNSPVKTY